MTTFDAFDAKMAAIVGSIFASHVTWHPMLAKASKYTGGDAQPDQARPVVVGLNAIVVWKPLTETAGVTDGVSGGNRGGISAFAVSIDIAVADFTAGGEITLPKVGDIFELSEEYDENRWVEIKRAADDGSMRAIFYGTAVTASEASG